MNKTKKITRTPIGRDLAFMDLQTSPKDIETSENHGN